MFFLLSAGQTRPSITEKNKGKKYHCDWARYCLGMANDSLHQKLVQKIQKNKAFYKGDQWSKAEDLETFLKDGNNQDRNRLALVMNKIRPMVEQYRGNAIRMNINFRIKSISPQVINRRETALAEALYYGKLANDPTNPFGEAMKKKLPVGDNEGETRAIFKNTYQDELVQDINYLADFVAKRNDFISKQPIIARDLAMCGIAVMTDFEYAGHQYFEDIPPETFFFDSSARKEDLRDAQFMGDVPELSPSEIFERFPKYINSTDKAAIEHYSKHFSGTTMNVGGQRVTHNGKVPIYRVFWRDGDQDEYGYVLDQYGYEYLTKINYTYDGEEKPRYTDKDLIKSDSAKAKKIFGEYYKRGELKRKLHYDVLRMAIIIPREILGSAPDTSEVDKNNMSDIVLDWGIAPYQETECLDLDNVKFPYKVHIWALIDGEILSPLDDAIDPQRFINRLWSVSENVINNSGGSNMVFDKDMIEDPAETQNNINQSKAIFLRAKGRGVQNAVQPYDATIRNGVANMFNIIQATNEALKETTGLNDALQGESMGDDQLVGVTKLMIQRGSLLQEPFYNAVTSIFLQCFQSIVSRGKRIYADNERNLAMPVGDDGVKVIKITKDMKIEDFRAFVTRENSDEILKNAANQMLLTFKQLGMLDDKRIAALWDRSTPEDVSRALRAYSSEKEELQRLAAKDEQKQTAALMQEANTEQETAKRAQHEEIIREDVRDKENKSHEIKKELLKLTGKIAPGNKRAERALIKGTEQAVGQ